MSEPTAEDRARMIVETWCKRTLTDEEGTRLIAAALLAAEARGRAEERERCKSVVRDQATLLRTIQSDAVRPKWERERCALKAEALEQIVDALDAAAVSREEKR